MKVRCKQHCNLRRNPRCSGADSSAFYFDFAVKTFRPDNWIIIWTNKVIKILGRWWGGGRF